MKNEARNKWIQRVLEIIGQTVVGDAITCFLVPRKHMRLWRNALPWPWWRNMVQWFIDRPRVTVATGVVEAIIGVALILRASRDA